MRLVVSVVVLLVLVLIVMVNRWSASRSARLDRNGLAQLRRIYRTDNPRGSGLAPLIHDQRRPSFKAGPKDG